MILIQEVSHCHDDRVRAGGYNVAREAHSLGEVNIAPFDVVLSDPSVVQPDIIFVATDRLPSFSDRGFEGASTLAVEVLSPSTARIDRTAKLHIYARHGVPYYWIVDPESRTLLTATSAFPRERPPGLTADRPGR